MAYYKKNNYKKGNRKYYNKDRAQKKSASNLKKFAYQLGRVSAGLKSDTQVKDSYEKGLNMKNTVASRKPLY